MTPIEEVLTFFKEWATVPEMDASFRRRIAPDAVWENVGASRTVGGEESADLLAALNSQSGIVRGEVVVHNIGAAGNVVFTERTDIFYRADDSLVASIRVMGIFEMDGPTILGWREYFDPRGLME
jgi:limonene-1,2-epoxide hydrolase